MFESHIVFVITVSTAVIIAIAISRKRMTQVTNTESQISKKRVVATSRPKDVTSGVSNLPTCDDDEPMYETKPDTGFEGPQSAFVDLDASDTFAHCEEYCRNAPSCRGFEASDEIWGKRCRFINNDTLSKAHPTSHPKRVVVDDKSIMYTKTCQSKLEFEDIASTPGCQDGWKKIENVRAVDRNIASLEANDPAFSMYDEFPRNNFEKCKDACVENPLCGAFQHNWNSSMCKLGEAKSSGEYDNDTLWTSYVRCKN